MKPVQYVVGFAFSNDGKQVALIRKNKPVWQRGLLNGIGGKVEEGEGIVAAMVREFEEETGVKTRLNQWSYFLAMGGTNDDNALFEVDFFALKMDLSKLMTMTDEVIEVVDVASIHPRMEGVIDNLTWLIPLALDHLADNRPSFVRATYGPKV